MPWSYDPEGADAISRIRLTIGDINESTPQYQNEELESLLDASGSETSAAIAAVRGLVARYARSTDKWVGDLKILASQRHRAYADLLDTLVSAGSGLSGVPFAGGIRQSTKDAINDNDDLIQPAFRVGLHNNED